MSHGRTGDLAQAEVTDPSALVSEYQRTYGYLHGQATRMTRSPEIAEEIVQEAFTNTMAAMDRGTEIIHLSAWLSRCVHNLAVKHLRERPEAQLPDEDAGAAGVGCVVESAIANERCARIFEAAQELSSDQRSAFLLHELRGLAYKEIAADLKCSVDNVRHLLHRARSRIRESVRPVNSFALLANWITSLARRFAELASQPAAALISGAVVMASMPAAAPELPAQEIDPPAARTAGVASKDGADRRAWSSAQSRRRSPLDSVRGDATDPSAGPRPQASRAPGPSPCEAHETLQPQAGACARPTAGVAGERLARAVPVPATEPLGGDPGDGVSGGSATPPAEDPVREFVPGHFGQQLGDSDRVVLAPDPQHLASASPGGREPSPNDQNEPEPIPAEAGAVGPIDAGALGQAGQSGQQAELVARPVR